jgi:hypothetical protein
MSIAKSSIGLYSLGKNAYTSSIKQPIKPSGKKNIAGNFIKTQESAAGSEGG